MASYDWFSGFLKINPTISVHTQEAASISRAIGLDRNVVASFYDILAEVIDLFKFHGNDIWNLDETGVTTVGPIEAFKCCSRKEVEVNQCDNFGRTW